MESEDLRLKNGMAVISGQIHHSMAAWSEQGTIAKTAALFRKVDLWLSTFCKDQQGLSARIRRFFVEDDDDMTGKLDTWNKELQNARTASITYRVRMASLAAEHRSAIEAYSAFLAALRSRIQRAGAQDLTAPQLVAYGTEYISAQQQLSQMVTLQLAEITMLESDITHVMLMTDALAKNHAAADRLLVDARSILEKYRGF